MSLLCDPVESAMRVFCFRLLCNTSLKTPMICRSRNDALKVDRNYLVYLVFYVIAIAKTSFYLIIYFVTILGVILIFLSYT